jgi:hypothetical protein
MKYESIGDIYTAHDKIRENFLMVARDISSGEAAALPDGEKWTIQQIIEHISIVEFNMLRICQKLTDAAREAGKPSSGTFSISPEFGSKMASIADIKVEAPERVHPTGDVEVSESIERLGSSTSSLAGLRKALEDFDGTDQTFPHPFFGDLTAAEWLIVRGGHEHRHTEQIKRLLERIRN